MQHKALCDLVSISSTSYAKAYKLLSTQKTQALARLWAFAHDFFFFLA